MVAITRLAAAISTVAIALAAPASEFIGPSSQVDELVNRAAAGNVPDFEIGGDALARRQDYTQNYKTGGNINFSPSSNGYSVSFSGAQDFVVGKGWSRGTSR